MTITGLLGGSFNPAHGGHRSISQFAIKALQLDDMWWLVSPGNPLKSDSKDMASLAARLASAKAMTRNSRIKATAIEDILNTRYTIDTIKKIQLKYPKHHFIWIMGADNLVQFHRWHKWRNIARIIPIVVIERPGYNDKAHFSRAMSYLQKYRKTTLRNNSIIKYQKYDKKWINAPALRILRFRPDLRSATKIRNANPNWYNRYNDCIVKDSVTHKIYV